MEMHFKEYAKKAARLVFGKYELVRIYEKQLVPRALGNNCRLEMREIEGAKGLSESGVEDIRSHAWYGAQNAFGYGVCEDGKYVCVCWYWKKGHEGLPSQLFPELNDTDAVMVDLITSTSARGRGYASALVAYSEQKLREAGIRRLWTWVWHSNTPSIRTFEKLSWRYSSFLVEIQPFQAGKRLRFRLAPH